MPTLSDVFCVQCCVFMRASRIGIVVEECMEDGKPYKLWQADEYQCPKCGVRVVPKFARLPFAEHWEPQYQSVREQVLQDGRLLTERTP